MAIDLIQEYKDHLGDAWLRLEPRSRTNEVEDGIAARIADPLWMLARQWQTGEFQGEDAGSPLVVTTQYSTHWPTHVQLKAGEQAKSLGDGPLEMLVEEEWVAMDWPTAIRVGQYFEQLLKTAHPEAVAKLRQEFPVTELPLEAEADGAGRQFVSFMAGKAVNGKMLLEWNRKTTGNTVKRRAMAAKLGIGAAPFEALIATLATWGDSLNIKVQPEKSKSWRNAQLDHRFRLENTNKDSILVAPSYRNGELDWYSFNACNNLRNLPWASQPRIVTVPTQTYIRGTALRWWEFEDAATYFGDVDTNPDDLARMLLIEFVLGYADDWFSVPIRVEMPNLVRIDNISVSNVFGELSSGAADGFVPAHVPDDDPLRRWELFTLSPAGKIGAVGRPGITNARGPGIGSLDDLHHTSLLFLPPLGGRREESPPFEEIHFLRDEGANMVWAVEDTVLNSLGKPVKGFDAQRERAARQRQERIRGLEARLAEKQEELEALPASGMDAQRAQLKGEIKALGAEIARLRGEAPDSYPEAPLYRLASTVPDNWIPFLPVQITENSIRLHRAHLLRNNDEDTTEAIPTHTQLLDREGNPDALLILEESAIPRAGRWVQLTAQRLRGVDGKTFVWLGRKVTMGGGEGESGLRFDWVK